MFYVFSAMQVRLALSIERKQCCSEIVSLWHLNSSVFKDTVAASGGSCDLFREERVCVSQPHFALRVRSRDCGHAHAHDVRDFDGTLLSVLAVFDRDAFDS